MHFVLEFTTYFVNNTDAKTGLANSVDQFPAATLWDTSSYLLGMIAAQRLKLISEKEFDARMKKALNSLARLPLIEDALPNKSYDMRSLAMIDYAGKPVPDGIGWSAIDIGRMVVPLHILVWHYPRHAGAAKKVISRWDLDRVVQSSMLFGASVASNGKLEQLQEGRLGYEQYAAKGFALLGLDVSDALNYRHQLAYVDIYGISVPYDKRDPTKFGARNFVLSEPYMLEGLEYGLDGIGKEFAWRVYQAQEARFKSANIMTAVSEDHLDKAPYFAYNTVFSDGKPWNMITEAGEDASAFRSMSVKTAFAWHALYRTDYTERLIETAASLHDRKKGWYAGLYEEGGQPNRALTANTNGVILESLAFIAHGPLMNAHRDAK